MNTNGIIAETIINKLKEQLKPIHLDVINESYMHNVPKNSETHFKVHVVSNKFDNLPLIKVSCFFTIFSVKKDIFI